MYKKQWTPSLCNTSKVDYLSFNSSAPTADNSSFAHRPSRVPSSPWPSPCPHQAWERYTEERCGHLELGRRSGIRWSRAVAQPGTVGPMRVCSSHSGVGSRRKVDHQRVASSASASMLMILSPIEIGALLGRDASQSPRLVFRRILREASSLFYIDATGPEKTSRPSICRLRFSCVVCITRFSKRVSRHVRCFPTRTICPGRTGAVVRFPRHWSWRAFLWTSWSKVMYMLSMLKPSTRLPTKLFPSAHDPNSRRSMHTFHTSKLILRSMAFKFLGRHLTHQAGKTNDEFVVICRARMHDNFSRALTRERGC